MYRLLTRQRRDDHAPLNTHDPYVFLSFFFLRYVNALYSYLYGYGMGSLYFHDYIE